MSLLLFTPPGFLTILVIFLGIFVLFGLFPLINWKRPGVDPFLVEYWDRVSGNRLWGWFYLLIFVFMLIVVVSALTQGGGWGW